jgi:hypothetical protein
MPFKKRIAGEENLSLSADVSRPCTKSISKASSSLGESVFFAGALQ